MNDLDYKAKPRTGLDAIIEAYKKDIDVTLIRENLASHRGPAVQATSCNFNNSEELQSAVRKARSEK